MTRHSIHLLVALACAVSPLFVRAQSNTFPSTGNVGIGTSSPSYLFQVAGGAIGIDGSQGAIFTSGDQTPFTATGVLLRGKGTTPSVVAQTATSDNTSAFAVYNSSVSPILFARADGNVGIGTSSPVNRLTVTGADGVVAKFTAPTNPQFNLSGASINALFTAHDTAGAFLGTSTAHPLSLYVNGATRMFIDTAGKVGIGTISPTAALEVKGPSTYQGTIRVNSGSGQYSSFGWMIGDAMQWSAYVHPGTTPSGGLIFATGAGLDAVTFSQNGNVGVGTTYPGEKLDVVGSIESSGGSAGMSRFVLKSTATGGQQYEWYNDFAGDGSGSLALYNRTSANTPMLISASGNVGIGTMTPTRRLDIATNLSAGNYAVGVTGAAGAARDLLLVGQAGYSNGFTVQYTGSAMKYLFADGNVGIGTTNPTQKLSVNGTIRAKEVIVDTNWADYVFEPSYRLAPLNEVENAIKEEGHLPGVPSAQEVSAKGISLGEMQAVLLAKIEELTLHQISQEKELHALKAQNAALQQRVGELENKQ
jgi:hypothetical protein